jgi:hypothetical protein
VATLALAATIFLGGRNRTGDVTGLVDYARARQRDPIELIVGAGRSHRIVFLADVHTAPEPKRLAVEAIDALARGPGLDAVVLEVDTELQPIIDRYLNSDPEDISILYRNPGTLHERWGVWREYLDIYRRVWILNRMLGPGRRIRIVAADLPGWPPVGPLPPRLLAEKLAARDAHMADRIDGVALADDPTARVLIFMGGFHGLKGGQAEIRAEGGAPIPVIWLAGLLQDRHPGEVFSILVDGTVPSDRPGPVGAYGSTRIADVLRKHLTDQVGPIALPVNDRFDAVRQPIRVQGGPGINLVLQPEGYRLQDMVDGYILVGSSGMGLLR